ncbi:MAG: DMT family transporter [Salibacteraceae bacterium]|nr:DMT family transporter [Salibacteraceae bacterium]
MKFEINTPARQYLSIALLALIWGSSFILMKRGLESFSAMQVAEYRLFISGLALLPLAFRQLKKIPIWNKEFLAICMVAIFGNLLPAILFATAQLKLPSGATGMLNSLVPLFTLAVGFLFFGVSPILRQILGVLIGLVGAVVLIFGSSQIGLEGVPIVYSLMVIAATLCYGISVNTIKSWLTDMSAFQITAFAFFVLMPFMVLGLFYNGFFEIAFETENQLNLGYLTILGIVGTAGALLLFNQLIKFTSAVFASSVTYMIPIVAMSWGLLDGEELNLFHAFGFILILVGVYVISRVKSKAKP